MLSEKIVTVLAALPYQPDAEWELNILPFGSIYWKDETPAIGDLFDKPDDMAIIFKMFGMRIKLWDGEALNAEDQQIWDAGKDQVPNWALFKRLSLSEGQRLSRQEVQRQVEQEFESLGSDPDCAERQLAISVSEIAIWFRHLCHFLAPWRRLVVYFVI